MAELSDSERLLELYQTGFIDSEVSMGIDGVDCFEYTLVFNGHTLRIIPDDSVEYGKIKMAFTPPPAPAPTPNATPTPSELLEPVKKVHGKRYVSVIGKQGWDRGTGIFDNEYVLPPPGGWTVAKEKPKAISDYPHKCPRCSKPCYMGLSNIDHEDKGLNTTCG